MLKDRLEQDNKAAQAKEEQEKKEVAPTSAEGGKKVATSRRPLGRGSCRMPHTSTGYI